MTRPLAPSSPATARSPLLTILAAIVLALPPVVAYGDTSEQIAFYLPSGSHRCFRHAAHPDATLLGDVLVVDGALLPVPVDLIVEQLTPTALRTLVRRNDIAHETFSLSPKSKSSPSLSSSTSSTPSHIHAHELIPQRTPPSQHSSLETSTHAEPPSTAISRLAEYRICLYARTPNKQHVPHPARSASDPRASASRKVILSFRSATDPSYLDHVPKEHIRNLLARKSDLNALQPVLHHLQLQVKNLIVRIDRMRTREGHLFRDLAASNNKILTYSITSCLAIVLTGAFFVFRTDAVLKASWR